MADTAVFEPGGYRYVPGPFQYSGGVAAEPGFVIERARFAKPPPLAEGFAAVERHLAGLARDPVAFCACELRSPAPFSEQGFRDFNRIYVGTLERWGIVRGDTNPVARSNVCPVVDPPAQPVLYAFSYTVPSPAAAAGSGFVVAGSAEAPEGHANYRDHIVRLGETSEDALREKARFVLGAMEGRMAGLGASWPSVTATQAYTVHDLHPFLGDEIVARGAAPFGLTWHYARPPVEGLEYEMDVRGVATEHLLKSGDIFM